MKKKLFLLNILLVIGVLLAACGTSVGTAPDKNQVSGGVHNASLALQATEEPPIVIPTIVINPTPAPGGGGSFLQIDPTTLLLYILVGAVIFIALIAVLKK